MKLSIIICVYNEVETINKIIKKVLNQRIINSIKKEIIIIDNDSYDGTKNILKKYTKHENIIIKYQKKNMGKGNSIIEGIKLSTGNIIIFQDADLEYDPSNYNILIEEMLKGNLDAVYGSRILSNKKYHIYHLHKFVVIFFTKLINIFFRTDFTDSATNYKLIKSSLLKTFELKAKSFAIDFEITIHLGMKNALCSEVPIEYNPRTYEKGKKIKIIDGLKSFNIIIKYIIKKFLLNSI